MKNKTRSTSKIKDYITAKDLTNGGGFLELQIYKSSLVNDHARINGIADAIFNDKIDFDKLTKWQKLSEEIVPTIKMLSELSMYLPPKMRFLPQDFSMLQYKISNVEVFLIKEEIALLKSGIKKADNPAKLIFARLIISKAIELFGREKYGLNTLIVKILKCPEVCAAFKYGYETETAVSRIRSTIKKQRSTK